MGANAAYEFIKYKYADTTRWDQVRQYALYVKLFWH